MAVKLITGDSGGAHITAANDGELNAGIVSISRVVLATGSKLEAEIVSNNLIRIKSGTMVDQGRQITIETDDYEEVVIDNGNMGMKRNDIIAFSYKKNESTLIETAKLVVIKGTPGSEGVDPELNTGNILNGDEWDEAALYRVKLDELNIVAVEPMFDVVLPMAELQEKMTEIEEGVAKLNSNYISKNWNASVPAGESTSVYESQQLTAGTYLFAASVAFLTSSNGLAVSNMRHNNVELQVARGSMVSGGGISNTAIVDCAHGDTLGLQVYQNHTATITAKLRIGIIKLR